MASSSKKSKMSLKKSQPRILQTLLVQQTPPQQENKTQGQPRILQNLLLQHQPQQEKEDKDDIFRYMENFTPVTTVASIQQDWRNFPLKDASMQGNPIMSSPLTLQSFRDYHLPALREILVNEQNKVAELTVVLTETTRNIEKTQRNIDNIESILHIMDKLEI